MNDYHYYRRLPHMQGRGGPLFVTFTTQKRRVLEPRCRDLVLETIQSANGRSFVLLAAVVMPDHVHLVLIPMIREHRHIPLKTILKGIKGTSARRINQFRGEKGAVWLDESFDRVLRKNSDLGSAIEYIAENPVVSNLVDGSGFYQWLWITNELTGQESQSPMSSTQQG